MGIVQSAVLRWLKEFMKFEFLMQFSTFGGFKVAQIAPASAWELHDCH